MVQRNTVRIIGGELRSRHLTFPAVPGLRPTPDRIRETLFNWLGDRVIGANCLDLFAGSGALAFEALSRGAAFVALVDNNALVTKNLFEQQAKLNLLPLSIDNVNALAWLNSSKQLDRQFDVIFLDPPFGENLIIPCVNALIQENRLKQRAVIYIETEPGFDVALLPSHLRLLKDKQAGNVCYRLFEYVSPLHTPRSGF
jgi:16S rRNA (guanine966-N2)-methyltransferase